MSPVKKRALISSVTIAGLMASQLVAGPAAFAAENADTPAPISAGETPAETPTNPHSALAALGDEEDAASASAQGGSTTETTTEGANGTQDSATSTSETRSETAATTTETTVAPETTQPTVTTPWIDLGFANWNFKDSFREYVGIEHEERTGMRLIGDRLLWYPKNQQKFDITRPTVVHFGGEVHWTKYNGILNVKISNPTLDFEKKELRVDAYTKGTLAGGGELTVTQQPLLKMDDLKWENRNGYILVHSLKPRITDLSRNLFGFYAGEVGAPFVATLETRELGEARAPQPILSELFPAEFPNGEKQLSDPNEAMRDVVIPDPILRECILKERDIENMDTPVTNKMLDMVQSLKCIRKATPDARVTSLAGLEQAKNLTTLNLNYNNIEDLTPLAKMTQLEVVELKGNKIRTLAPLADLTNVTRLNVAENKLSNLKGIEKMTKIERLDADDNRISNIEALPVGAQDLRRLSLSKNRIESLAPLAPHKWIRELYVDNNHITAVEGLDKIRGVEKLKIQNNYITDPSHFAEWANRSHVVSMYVGKNLFTNWSVLDDVKDKVRDWPNEGEEATSVNPVSLEEAKAKAAEVDAADPAPSKPAQPSKPETAPKKMVADLNWGLRDTFRRYIKTVAHGDWTVSEGATWVGAEDKINGYWVFPAAEGQTISRNTTKFDYKGKLHFVGHGGKLDITISNPSIEQVGQEWKLFADVHSKPLAGGIPFAAATSTAAAEPITGRIALATVGAPTPAAGAHGHAYTFTSATLTDQGSAVFGNVYDQDRRLDVPQTVLRPAATPNEGNGQGTGSQDSSNTGTTEPAKKLTADLNWGIRDSFINYINKPFVAGKIVATEGAKVADNGGYTFTLDKTETVAREGLVKAQFAGKIHITGHAGKLDISIANPSIDKTPAGWKLSATVASKPFNASDAAGVGFRSFRAASETSTAAPQPTRVILADLSDPVVTTAGDVTTYAFANVVLTEEGARAFGGFYRVGDRVMAPLAVAIRTATEANTSQSGENQQSGTQEETPKAEEPKKPETNIGAQKPAQPAKPEKKQCQVDPHKMRITSGNLSWGVRSSFTTYIRGLAKGGWDLAGTSWDGSDFNFPVAGGVYNTATRSGTIYYSGSVHFYGHKGVLDLTIANPVLEINGNSGDLYLTVNGSDTSGNKFALGRVHFASVYFNGVYASNGSLSFDGASVTLSGSGAQAFAGFYGAGEALDGMSSYASMVHATACDPVTGELIEYNAFGENLGIAGTGLASTGANAGSLAALSLALLLFGAVARRRVTR